MFKTPIHDFLNSYSKKDKHIRCHMPGHKGRYSGYGADITEIFGAGALFDENRSIISESENTASGLFGSEATFFSAGGSTLAIQAMLSLLKKSEKGKNGKIIAGRYSHKSLISASVLLGFETLFVYPCEYLSSKITPEAIEETIISCGGNISGVFLTSADYFGGMCDIRKISVITEKYGLPLLVDNAHGAYLVFTDNHPLKQGASMTADSAHKTLPALTGAAYLHIGKSEHSAFFTDNAKRETALFGSSSPSYLILESLDLCNRHIAEEKERAKQAFFYTEELKRKLIEQGCPLCESDAVRVVIDTARYGYRGFEFAHKLRFAKPFGIECEMYDENRVVLLFSTVTDKQDTDAVFNAILSIPQKKPLQSVKFPIIKPRAVMTCREAYYSSSEAIRTEDSLYRICAEINAPCPPCIPLIMPGEIFDTEMIETLKLYGITHVRAVKE